MEKVKSAGELEAAPREQKIAALEQVRQFCERQGLEPAQFMSAMGWLKEGRWRQGVDWKDCVKWSRFNNMIFSGISPTLRKPEPKQAPKKKT